MKKVIGAEISPRPRPAPEPKPAAEAMPVFEDAAAPRMPHSQHLLDLRKKPSAPEPAAEAEERPVQEDRGPTEVPAGSLVIHDRVAEDVARLGMHQEADAPPPQTEERGSVRSREGGIPAGGKRRLFRRGKLTLRQVLIAMVKVFLVMVGAVLFLLLSIPLPERLIGIYFVTSIVYNIDSQRTFIVALIFLVMVAVSSAIGKSVPAESYAVYAFYFLVIGLLAAIREQISNRSKTGGGNSQLSDKI